MSDHVQEHFVVLTQLLELRNLFAHFLFINTAPLADSILNLDY